MAFPALVCVAVLGLGGCGGEADDGLAPEAALASDFPDVALVAGEVHPGLVTRLPDTTTWQLSVVVDGELEAALESQAQALEADGWDVFREDNAGLDVDDPFDDSDTDYESWSAARGDCLTSDGHCINVTFEYRKSDGNYLAFTVIDSR